MKEGPAYHRGDVPFLALEETQEAIASMAEARELTVFCGAGVTIDRTDRGWIQLINAIMADRKRNASAEVTPQVVGDVRGLLDPLQLATVAWSCMKESSRDERTAQGALRLALQSELYPTNDWRAGLLVGSIIELCAARAVMGMPTTLVTSNYDCLIEEQYEILREVALVDRNPFPGLEVRVLNQGARTLFEPVETSSRLVIEYLHGRVPREGHAEGEIAFSEGDYSRLRKNVSKRLRLLFGGDVLVLGSSLTDPPLVNALAANSSRGTHVALLPMLSMSASESERLTEIQGKALSLVARTRMREFGVSLLAPDFYFQIGQFLEEIRLSTVHGESYRDYSGRLSDWWRSWSDTNDLSFTGEVHEGEAADEEDLDFTWLVHMHSELRDAIDMIREELCKGVRKQPSEYLKLELWLRVPEGTHSRALKLVAASNAVVVENGNPRLAALSLDSEFSSVRAFSEGRPRIDDAAAPAGFQWNSPTDVRWRTFLSVPIRSQFQGGRLPVGSLTLASNLPRPEFAPNSGPVTQIRPERAAHIAAVVQIMSSLGEQLLSVPRSLTEEPW